MGGVKASTRRRHGATATDAGAATGSAPDPETTRTLVAYIFVLLLDQRVQPESATRPSREVISTVLRAVHLNPPAGSRQALRDWVSAADRGVRTLLNPTSPDGRGKIAALLHRPGWTKAFIELCTAGCEPGSVLVGLIDALPLRVLPGKTNPIGLRMHTLRRLPKRIEAMAVTIEKVVRSEMISAVDRAAEHDQKYLETARIHQSLPELLRHFALNLQELLKGSGTRETKIGHWANPNEHDRQCEQRLVYWVERETGRPHYRELGELLDRDPIQLRTRTKTFRSRPINRDLLRGEFGDLQSSKQNL
jgi:hypothetical protein